MNKLKDFTGNTINESDLVVFSTFGCSDLSMGIVVKITAKMIRIYPTKGIAVTNTRWGETTVLRNPEYMVVVGHNQEIPAESGY